MVARQGGNHPPMREGRIEIGVLADDLTGALASAARLKKRGLLPAIHWRLDGGPPGTDAVVIDMRTRDRGVDPRAQARHWAGRLRELGCQRFELRTDSTFRGNPAAELDGLIEGAGFADPLVLAVPAFPDAGRITVGGRQLVRGGTEHDVARLLFGDRPASAIGRSEVEAGPQLGRRHG
jgi:D-threonate/D-erythronate kinase